MTTKICKRFRTFGYTCVSTFQSFYTCYTMCVSQRYYLYGSFIKCFFLAPFRFPYSVLWFWTIRSHLYRQNIFWWSGNKNELASFLFWVLDYFVDLHAARLFCLFHVTVYRLPFVHMYKPYNVGTITLWSIQHSIKLLHQIRTTTLCLLPLTTFFFFGFDIMAGKDSFHCYCWYGLWGLVNSFTW